jgi:2,3-bisphosphoglycerate-independent phosphoglycerate mutase
MRKVLLVILDGWGHSDFEGTPSRGNAIELADVPTFRRLYDGFPRTRLASSGGAVGLPDGQMGNSEVGHLNLGAGRVVYQDIARVDKAIAEGSFADALGLDGIVEHVRERDSTIHVVGLVSDGGVHSHLRHFIGLLDLLPEDVTVRLHCITDGRDTSPTGGVGYLSTLDQACSRNERWAIATVCGRYWVMDRDRRWERTKRGFDLMVHGEAAVWADDLSFLAESYAAGTTDEFVEPTGIRGVGETGMAVDDVVILMNFRADRMRQLTAALSSDDFDGFDVGDERPGRIVTMTEYQERLPVDVAFPKENVRMGLSEYLASRSLKQLKVAETEKYAHVTYFFNGGEEAPWEGEDRSLIPSPRVATYDLQPEMSARGVADAVIEGLRGEYDFILVNFANPDMVGHTGVVSAAVSAVEAVDACMTDILDTLDAHPEWVALVTADHGNCEMMIDADGNPHTAHTTEPVDLIVYDPKASTAPAEIGLRSGRLADVAPTVLAYMELDQPAVMTGEDLVTSRSAD